MAYRRFGKCLSFFICLIVLMPFSFFVSALRMARVFLTRKSSGMRSLSYNVKENTGVSRENTGASKSSRHNHLHLCREHIPHTTCLPSFFPPR